MVSKKQKIAIQDFLVIYTIVRYYNKFGLYDLLPIEQGLKQIIKETIKLAESTLRLISDN